jgi:hypothetical protein
MQGFEAVVSSPRVAFFFWATVGTVSTAVTEVKPSTKGKARISVRNQARFSLRERSACRTDDRVAASLAKAQHCASPSGSYSARGRPLLVDRAIVGLESILSG